MHEQDEPLRARRGPEGFSFLAAAPPRPGAPACVAGRQAAFQRLFGFQPPGRECIGL